MKTLVLSMISIAATIAAMTACTSESDPINDITNPKDAKVEIKLNAGVGSLNTKTSIESNSNGIPTSDVSNIFLYKQEVNGTTADWTNITTTPINVTIKETNGNIDFGANTQYYPLDGKNVHFIGYHTGQNQETSIENGSIPITITGEEDVLYGKSFDAGTRTTATNTSMGFVHKLTQIKFTIQKAAAVTDDVIITNMKITKASNTDLKNSFKMSLTNGELSGWEGTIENGISLTNYPTEALQETASTSTVGVMLEPEIASVTVEVYSTSFPNGKLETTINGISDGKFSAGTAYTIALTVKASTVSGNASIEHWTENNTGTGEL